MAKHRRHKRRHTGPNVLLGLSILSVGSPIGLLAVAQPLADAESPTQKPSLIFGPPQLELQGGIEEARLLTKTKTTTTTSPSKRSVPVSTPVPTVSTRPSRPSVIERATQKATTTTTTTRTATPKKTTTTQTPTSTPKVVPPSTTTRSPTRSPPPTTQKPPPPTTTRTTTQVPTPAPQPSGTAHIVSIARKYVGTGIPYAMGGNSLTSGMDCSHFVWMVLKEAGYKVPYRDSGDLAAWSSRVKEPQAGDLVLYEGHVGIYVGSGMMIDQGRSGGAFLRKVFTDNFIGYGRMPL
jgi:cell wall-associated NlpC family hydrolase